MLEKKKEAPKEGAHDHTALRQPSKVPAGPSGHRPTRAGDTRQPGLPADQVGPGRR